MSTLFKKNDKWWADYTVNGKRIRKPISTSKKEAQKFLIDMDSKILHKKYLLPIDNKMTLITLVKKYMEEYSIHKRSFKTDVSLSKPVVRHLGSILIHEISKKMVMEYRNIRKNEGSERRKRSVSETTLNREVAFLRSVLNKAVEWEYLSYNPIQGVKLAKEEIKERILTIAELQKLVDLAPCPLKYIILVAINLGMRRNEILTLEWDRVNLESGFIYVAKTKTGDPRGLPLNEALLPLFKKLRKDEPFSKYVFANPSTKKPYVEIKTAWKSLLKKAGIEDFRFHDLRHNFATHCMLNGGGNLRDLMKILGHSNISTTLRYSKAQMEGMQRLVNAINISGNDQGPVIPLAKNS